MASTIWVAFSTSWPSIIMNYNAGLDRCHLPRSLIVALLDRENLYNYFINAPLTFPCSASGKPILRRKDSFTTTLSRPELLISTNITPLPHKESKLSPNYSLDPPMPSLRKLRTQFTGQNALVNIPNYSRSSYKQYQFQQAWPRFQLL